jgi:hypothetical protein
MDEKRRNYDIDTIPFKISIGRQTKGKILQGIERAKEAKNEVLVKKLDTLLKLGEGRSPEEVAGEIWGGDFHKLYDNIQDVLAQGIDNLVDKTKPKLKGRSPQISDDGKVLSVGYNKLLYWLSSIGCGSQQSFKKACGALQLEEPKSISRKLKLLGHLEFSEDGKKWSVAPTGLIKIPAKKDIKQFVLCGQRSIKFIEELEKYAEVKTFCQPKGKAPNCIRIKTKNTNLITSQLPIINAGVASLKLAEALPELSAWQQNLTDLPGIVPSLYDWKRWEVNKNKFIECYFEGKTGMYEMKNREQNGKNRPPMTLFYDGETQTWKQGDWYGLRYLAWYHSREPCRAWYDSANRRFAVPYCQRLPELYERALVLASGLLPYFQIIENNTWLIYENIDRQLMQKLTEKLHVIYQET